MLSKEQGYQRILDVSALGFCELNLAAAVLQFPQLGQLLTCAVFIW
jgi:hypothetical protein